jgi:RecB family exonuclease
MEEQTNSTNTQVDLNGNPVTGVAQTIDKKPESIKSDKFPRVQSPSSINTFRQCPRKYYYNYIEKLAILPSIHLTRGKLTHSVLEDFFDINVEHLSAENFMFDLQVIIMEIFKKHWAANLDELNSLGLSIAELRFYNEETQYMVKTWVKRFIHTVAEDMKNMSFKESFIKHTPIREEEYRSEERGVRGFIDVIQEFEKEIDGKKEKEVHVIDYKTSKRAKMSPEYKLQLAIYAMLYEEKHGFLPNKVGIDFLKFDEPPMYLDVDEDLVEFAKREVAFIHENTVSKDLADYSKKISALCKWHSGQCSFYDLCKGQD